MGAEQSKPSNEGAGSYQDCVSRASVQHGESDTAKIRCWLGEGLPLEEGRHEVKEVPTNENGVKRYARSAEAAPGLTITDRRYLEVNSSAEAGAEPVEVVLKEPSPLRVAGVPDVVVARAPVVSKSDEPGGSGKVGRAADLFSANTVPASSPDVIYPEEVEQLDLRN